MVDFGNLNVSITNLDLLTVPTGSGKPGRPGKMGEHFPVREKSENFVQTGKVREFYPEHYKSMEND